MFEGARGKNLYNSSDMEQNSLGWPCYNTLKRHKISVAFKKCFCDTRQMLPTWELLQVQSKEKANKSVCLMWLVDLSLWLYSFRCLTSFFSFSFFSSFFFLFSESLSWSISVDKNPKQQHVFLKDGWLYKNSPPAIPRLFPAICPRMGRDYTCSSPTWVVWSQPQLCRTNSQSR